MAMARTNIELDTSKLEEVKKLAGFGTAKAAVNFALDRLSRSARALSTLMAFSGKVSIKKGYSYKKSR
jgi:Arc/MetJ family transcription regulator